MIITTQDIINFNKCDEWTEERSIDFMNSGVYTNIGEKTIFEFIKSVGVNDITYEEIFWMIIQKLSIEQRFNLCLKLIKDEYLNIVDDENFIYNYNSDIIATEEIIFINQINQDYINELKEKEDYIIKNEDYNNKSRLYYVLIKLLTDKYILDTDLLKTTYIITSIILQQNSNITYLDILEYIVSLYE